jgi:DNA-binding response OmpR family regulator
MGTVLVVDDDRAVCKLVSAVLARDGLDVESVEDGPSALARLGERDYALVLTDMTMPGMSGLELIRAAEEQGHTVPFLVMSAYLDPATEQSIVSDPGVLGVLRKPFELARLVSDVRAVLDRVSDRVAVGPAPAQFALVPLELFELVAARLAPRRLAGMRTTMRPHVAPRPAARREAAAGRAQRQAAERQAGAEGAAGSAPC